MIKLYNENLIQKGINNTQNKHGCNTEEVNIIEQQTNDITSWLEFLNLCLL